MIKFGFGKKSGGKSSETSKENSDASESPSAPESKIEEIKRQPWLARLRAGLGRSSSKLAQGISGVFGRGRPDPATLEELEDLLISADLGPTVAARLTAATIGTVAWPPQGIRFTFGAARCSPRLTVGTTFGPRAAGVRSIAAMPRSASTPAYVTKLSVEPC